MVNLLAGRLQPGTLKDPTNFVFVELVEGALSLFMGRVPYSCLAKD